VRLAAVQIDRHANNRDVRRHERVHHELPPREAQEAVGKEIKQGIQQGNLPVEREKQGNKRQHVPSNQKATKNAASRK
jgi:hypothetical protein